MGRFAGYMKEKQKHELIIKKPMELSTVSLCDSRHGDFKDTRKITMGEVHTIVGDITSWNSQQNKTVKKFSIKSQYIKLSEADKEQKSTQM